MAHGLDKGRFLDVAELEEQVIGYVMGGPLLDDEFRRGELRQISIHPAYQRSGIGRLLVEHVARVFLLQNIRIVHVETLECSPHRGFYEHLGARLVALRTHDWDGVLLPMCVYRWEDLSSLVIERAPPTPRRVMDRIAASHYA
jgi:GNAT superfamily N-acetyltransferase